MRNNYKKLGDHIRLVDVRNKELKDLPLVGVTVNKKFISSVANTIGANMKGYKIIKRNQFACSLMQVRRDGKIPVALFEYEEAIISQAYPVFEIVDENKLLPQYLMMWMSRSEFDREACFYAVGGVRGSLEWEDFCAMELPIPSIEKQREIVAEYYAITNRIKLNEQLNQKLEETAQAIYKEWFVDFEFPDENGKPYKSNGGEMVWCEKLGKEIPKGWGLKFVKDIATIKGGKRLPKGESLILEKTEYPYIKVADLGIFKKVVLNHKFEYLKEEVQKQISIYTVNENDVVISIVGTIGLVRIIDASLDNANLTENCIKITNLKNITSDYLYYFLNSSVGQHEIEMRTVGGVQGKLPIYNIESLQVLCPSEFILEEFTNILNKTNTLSQSLQYENINLQVLRSLMLSKMATVE